MLPQLVFDEIVKTSGLRIEAADHERRSSPRIPLRGSVEVRSIVQNCASAPVLARLKDISHSGIAVLVVGKQAVTKEFIIRLSIGAGRYITLWCDTRRTAAFDGSCTVVSAMFLKMMLPGQQLRDHMPVSSVNWHAFKIPTHLVPQDTAAKPAAA